MLDKKCRWCGARFASGVGLRCHQYGFCSDDCGYLLIPPPRREHLRVYGVTRAVLADFDQKGAASDMPEVSRNAPRRS